MDLIADIISKEQDLTTSDKDAIVAFFESRKLMKYVNDSKVGIKINLGVLSPDIVEDLHKLIIGKISNRSARKHNYAIEYEDDGMPALTR